MSSGIKRFNEDFIAREFGAAPHRRTGLQWDWWALALVLMAAGLIIVR